MVFEEIASIRYDEIEKCKNFIKFIRLYFKNSEISGTNSYILIKLLNDKISLYDDFNYLNCKSKISKLNNINENIYTQIIIFRSEISYDFNNFSLYNLKFKYDISNISKNIKHIISAEIDFYEKNKSQFLQFNLDKTYDENYKKKIMKNIYNNEYFDNYINQKLQTYKIKAVINVVDCIKKYKWFSTMLFFTISFASFLIFYFCRYEKIPFMDKDELYQILMINSFIVLSASLAIFIYLYLIWFLYNYDKINKNFKSGVPFYKSSFIVTILLSLMIFVISLVAKYPNVLIDLNKNSIIEILAFFILVFLFFCFIIYFLVRNNIFLSFIFCFIFILYFFVNIQIGNSNGGIPLYLVIASIFLFWYIFVSRNYSKYLYEILGSIGFIFLIIAFSIFISEYIYEKFSFYY